MIHLETLPDSDKPLGDIVAEHSDKLGVDPNVVLQSLKESGIHNVKNEYSGDDEYPVSGHDHFGLSNFGDHQPDLVKKGLIPKDMPFSAYTAKDPNGNIVHPANFKTVNDAVLAHTAMIKHLTPEAETGEDGGGDKPNEISNTHRADWNAYTDWLAKKGLKGNPSLDKNDLGFKMIDQYRKENPNTTVSREMITPIQNEFSKYRDWALNEVKGGRMMMDKGTTPENYMKSLSIVDGIPGQRTTSFKFPDAYLKETVNGEKKKIKDLGFANKDSFANK